MLRKIERPGADYVLPTVLVVAAAMLYSSFCMLIMGFLSNTLFIQTLVFCGTSQYKKSFRDKVLIDSIGDVLLQTFRNVFFQLGLGLTMALVLHQPFIRGKTFIHILLMTPWVTPSIIGSVMWKWMYNADYGTINFTFCSLGIIEINRMWLSNPKIAMQPVIAVNTWKTLPLTLLMIEAALQSVSGNLKEAAMIDGANILDISKNVIWPSIAATCYSIILLIIIWTLNASTFICAVTEGGPVHKTEVTAMYTYKRVFVDCGFGMTGTVSAILFVLSMSVSLVCLYLTREEEGK